MFKDLSRFDISKATSWCDMPELGTKARILLAPATEANPAYYNAMLELSGKRVRALARSDKITAEDAAQSRDEDVLLYPRFVIRGWEGIEAGDGADEVDEQGHVPFSRSRAAKLCQMLNEKAPHLLDRLRNHAATPERFYAPDQLPPMTDDELEDLAGN